jgi:glycosyltransferase involved in cell wall biosynthesis
MVIGIDASRVAQEDKTGTENYSWNIIQALVKVDKKNRYVLYFNKLPQFFEISQSNISTKVIGMTRFWTQIRLSLECLTHPPDILFVPAHTIPIVRRPSLKTVVTIHDLGVEFLAEYHKFPQKLYLNWATGYVAKNANHLIAVSKSTKKDLTDTLKVSSKRISVVYEGVDTNFFCPQENWKINAIRSKYGLSKNYFLYVGTIQPRKNLARLIEAFAKMKSRNFDLAIAGNQGWLIEEIMAAPKKFSIGNKVRFVGFVPSEDLPALYSGAIALAFPSLYEGFGLPILEAFASGCPVLTSNRNAMAEVAGKAALLVNPEEVTDIATGLKKLSAEDKLRNSLTERGFERVKGFSWEKTALETIKVFEKVYSGK